MNSAENVFKFYVLANKLKNVIRTGWKKWNVECHRLESVAEHIYGVQMLAIAIHSEYQYDIDIQKVIFMLAVHELEEISIGDLTQFEISKEEKRRIGYKAVCEVLDGLTNKEYILQLIEEFEERQTKESKFAYQCDKLECDLQCKLYDDKNYVDLNKQENNEILNDELVEQLLKEGKSWSDMWMTFGQMNYNYDNNFKAISDYVNSQNCIKREN